MAVLRKTLCHASLYYYRAVMFQIMSNSIVQEVQANIAENYGI